LFCDQNFGNLFKNSDACRNIFIFIFIFSPASEIRPAVPNDIRVYFQQRPGLGLCNSLVVQEIDEGDKSNNDYDLLECMGKCRNDDNCMAFSYIPSELKENEAFIPTEWKSFISKATDKGACLKHPYLPFDLKNEKYEIPKKELFERRCDDSLWDGKPDAVWGDVRPICKKLPKKSETHEAKIGGVQAFNDNALLQSIGNEYGCYEKSREFVDQFVHHFIVPFHFHSILSHSAFLHCPITIKTID
jgi:hypothetical protein